MIKNFILSLVYSKTFHAMSILIDVVSISYFFYSSFFIEVPLIRFEIALGIYLILEYILLLIVSKNKWAYIKHPLAISNILIIIGFLAAPFWNIGILRILRVLRVVHLYQIIPDIRSMTRKLLVWEKLFATLIHGTVLVFIITEVVLILQKDSNPDIGSRFDAFYFTTNAIAKIGNGDSITLVGVDGRILTLIIAILGFSIFLHLIEVSRETMKIRKDKKGNKFSKEDLNEIYLEQLCTYCDIKNRDILMKTKSEKN